MSNEALTWAYRQTTGKGAGCKAVLIALADFADQEGSCYPGQEKLAEMTEQNSRSVRRQIEALIELGLVIRESRYKNGHRTSDRYYLQMGPRAVAEEPRELIPDTTSGMDMSAFMPDRSASIPDTSALIPDTMSGYPLEEPLEEPPVERARGLAADFDEWYEAYPRKAGRGDAERKYRLARRRGVSRETLLAGAQRFRDDPNRDDAFTPHPSTWLHQGRWDDAPLPARNSGRVEPRVERPGW